MWLHSSLVFQGDVVFVTTAAGPVGACVGTLVMNDVRRVTRPLLQHCRAAGEGRRFESHRFSRIRRQSRLR